MTGKVMLKIWLFTGLAVIIGIIFLVLSNQKTQPLSENKTLLDKASNLIELADSVRNSEPDTALYYFNQAKLIVEPLESDFNKNHLLANSFLGIAYIQADRGDFVSAMENDSIAMEIATKNKDNKLVARAFLIKGLIFFYSGDYEKALGNYEKSMVLAVGEKDLETQAKLSSNKAIIYIYQGDINRSIQEFTNAIKIGKQLKNEGLVAGNYMNLANVFNSIGKNDSVLVNYNFALEIFKRTNQKNGELQCHQNIGNVFFGSDYSKSIESYQMALRLAIEMDDKPNIATCYQNLSQVYLHLGDYENATEFQFKSITINEQINDKLSLAMGYSGAGTLFYTQKDYSKALIYYRKSLHLFQELESVREIGSGYSSIANVYSDENKLDSAIVYYKKAMKLYEKVDYINGISNLCINLGDVYRVKEDYSRSETLLMQALKIKTELAEEEGIANANRYLANLYSSMADGLTEKSKIDLLNKAEVAGLKSYHLAKRLGTLPVRRDVSKALKKIYLQQGRFQEALKYSEISNALSDSILNKEKIQALTFAEARWNIEKKQQEVNNLAKTQKLNQEVIAQKETEAKQHWIIIWILVALFLLGAAATTFIALYIRKRRDALYQKQLSNITILRMQNIRNALSPHFVFNVLNNIWAIIDDRENARAQFDHLINLIRRSLVNTEKLAIPMKDEINFVKSFIELQKMRMDNNLDVIWNIESGIELAQPIPGMILQIPVENAIKHGLEPKKDDRVLLIDIKTESGFLKFNISDNGLGLQQTPSQTKGTGTGLKVLTNTIHILNQINNEKMSYQIVNREVEDGPGTKVIIKIPLQYNYNLN